MYQTAVAWAHYSLINFMGAILKYAFYALVEIINAKNVAEWVIITRPRDIHTSQYVDLRIILTLLSFRELNLSACLSLYTLLFIAKHNHSFKGFP